MLKFSLSLTWEHSSEDVKGWEARWCVWLRLYTILMSLGKGIYQLANELGQVLKKKANINRSKPFKRYFWKLTITLCYIEEAPHIYKRVPMPPWKWGPGGPPILGVLILTWRQLQRKNFVFKGHVLSEWLTHCKFTTCSFISVLTHLCSNSRIMLKVWN